MYIPLLIDKRRVRWTSVNLRLRRKNTITDGELLPKHSGRQRHDKRPGRKQKEHIELTCDETKIQSHYWLNGFATQCLIQQRLKKG